MTTYPHSLGIGFKELQGLKKVYKKATKENKDRFEFQNKELLTVYAKYLIEYLETQIKK